MSIERPDLKIFILIDSGSPDQEIFPKFLLVSPASPRYNGLVGKIQSTTSSKSIPRCIPQFWTGSIPMQGSGQSLLTILKHSQCYVMGCRWSRLICTLILLHALGMSSKVEAQHCGRIGYMPEWNQSLMSWEGTGSVSAVSTTDDLWRLKGQSCDGPLCRSQAPVPLAPHDPGSGLDSLLPWRCTAFLAACPMDPFIGRLLMGQELAPLGPALDRLFKPPRSI